MILACLVSVLVQLLFYLFSSCIDQELCPLHLAYLCLKTIKITLTVQRIFLDYTYGIGKIYTQEELEKAKASPSFEREYNLKYLGKIG